MCGSIEVYIQTFDGVDFLKNFMLNFFSTVAGLVLGIPIALHVSKRFETRTQKKEVVEAKGLLEAELARSIAALNESIAGNSGTAFSDNESLNVPNTESLRIFLGNAHCMAATPKRVVAAVFGYDSLVNEMKGLEAFIF
jgi:hypothetical protein